jgi:hypothetical protein
MHSGKTEKIPELGMRFLKAVDNSSRGVKRIP